MYGQTSPPRLSRAPAVALLTSLVLLITTLAPSLATARPSGRTVIAFSSRRAGNMDIWRMRLDGSGIRRLTTDPAGDRHPSWSPDGRRLAFMSMRAGGNPDIYVMRADGSRVRRLTDAPGEDCCPE